MEGVTVYDHVPECHVTFGRCHWRSFDVTCLCTMTMSNYSMIWRMSCDRLMCCISVQWFWFILCQTTLWYGEWVVIVWCVASLYNESDLSYVKLLYDMANELWSFDVLHLCTMNLIYHMSNYCIMWRMSCDRLMCCISVQWIWFIICQTTVWYGEWVVIVWCVASLYNESDLSYVKLLTDMANELWSFDVLHLCTMNLIYHMSNYCIMWWMICGCLMWRVYAQWLWFILCQYKRETSTKMYTPF